MQMYELVLLAIVVWREARGESIEAKRAVAWSIRNRVQHPGWWGSGWVGVILKPFQYSSFNHNDVNAVKWPSVDDASWNDCMTVANEVYSGNCGDTTDGATHYFDKSLDAHPPDWATDGSMVRTVDVGSLHFWKHA
jgi:N-acetylmuramoyl-L-alanine amidase